MEMEMEEEELKIDYSPSPKAKRIYKDYYTRNRQLAFWKLFSTFRFYAKIRGPMWAAAYVYPKPDDQVYAIMTYRGFKKQNHRRISTDEEEKIVKMYLLGFSIYRIAKELHRPFSTIYYVLQRNGLK